LVDIFTVKPYTSQLKRCLHFVSNYM